MKKPWQLWGPSHPRQLICAAVLHYWSSWAGWPTKALQHEPQSLQQRLRVIDDPRSQVHTGQRGIQHSSCTYAYSRGYIWNQHVPMNILEVIGRAATDPVHASLCMALYHTGTALARHMPSTVQEPLLRYTAQFQIHSKQEFNEEEKSWITKGSRYTG